MMKTTLGKEGLEKSWQDPFSETTECHKCGGEARIAFVAHEHIDGDDRQPQGEGEPPTAVRWLHENTEDAGWPHDACCFAIYICKKCYAATVVWNQA